MVKCYNCGIEISKKNGNQTKEHIPAKNLFEGYDDKYKNNRITVPSCLVCNNGSIDLDNEFRDMIGTISNHNELNVIAKNTVKSIFHYNKQYNRLHINKSGEVTGVTFNKRLILDNHKKIFKGLFYDQYKKPIGSEYHIVSTVDPTDQTQMFVAYLQHNFKWKCSGHPDVFEYILQPFRENFDNPSKKDLKYKDGERAYLGLLKYNQSHVALVFATNKHPMSV